MAIVADNAGVLKSDRSFRWHRVEQANKLEQYRTELEKQSSQRTAAKLIGVPRSTLQSWILCGETLDADPTMIAFFESSPGLAFLHQLVTAMHVVFVELGACGIRLVSRALTLSGLDRFVASSFEVQRRFNVALQEQIIAHANSEKTRLAETMPKKEVTVAKDETFTGGLTLVAIEPESGYILLEEASEKRDSESWAKAMDKAMSGLNCQIIQSTSDEGKGIVAYAEKILGAHHSPDLFHVQQELSRATSGPMAAKVRAAEKEAEKAAAELTTIQLAFQKYQEDPASRGPGRPPRWEQHINDAEAILAEKNLEVERIKSVKNHTRSEVKSLGEIYHLVDLDSGKRRNGSIVADSLQHKIDSIRNAALTEGIGESSMDRIAKAERVIPKMKATIDFVLGHLHSEVNKLKLTATQTYLFHSNLIPGCYLERIAAKRNKTEGDPLRNKALELMDPIFALDGAFSNFSKEARLELRCEADRLAGFFQRSSSCVEGRNGVLAFRHQELRGISSRKRQCLTALHNFFIERKNGTTAAERFFCAKSGNLFHAVLRGVEVPRRPKSPPRKQMVLN
jgi:hypothetical protein